MGLSSECYWIKEAEGPLQQWRGRCQGRGQGDCADDILDEMNSRPNPWSYKGGVEFERVVAQEITEFNVIKLKNMRIVGK